MEVLKQITVRGMRQKPLVNGEWVASEVDGGYTVKCGDAVLHTVNSGRPRVFRSLEGVKQALKQEMGITEFKVEALKS